MTVGELMTKFSKLVKYGSFDIIRPNSINHTIRHAQEKRELMLYFHAKSKDDSISRVTFLL